MNFLITIRKFQGFSVKKTHPSYTTPGMNLLQICFHQRWKATSQQFYISTASSACQTTTQVLKMLFNMHLYARAQMTILQTEFLASQRSSTDSQCWVSKRVGARRMTLWTADWREVGGDRIGSTIMSKSETFQVSGDFFTHPQSVSTGHTKADPVTQKKKEKKWWKNYNNDNGEIRTGTHR